MNVLLIADHPDDVRQFTAFLAELERPELAVVSAPRLEDGLRCLDAHRIDLILLDLALPDVSGPEAVARAHAAAPAVPIVVLTGLDDDEMAFAAMKEGAQDYLVKGQVDANVLSRSLRYAIGRKRAEEGARRLMQEKIARAQAEAAERRSRFLSQASDVLSSSLDYTKTLAAATELLVPFLADSCSIDVADDTGAIPARIVEKPTSSLGAQGGVRLEIPLTTHKRQLGLMTLGRDTDPFSNEDIDLANEFARKAALAVENARLYRAREEVIRIVSHDLRNPLNVISLAAASLGRPGIAPTVVTRQCEKIRRSVERMNRLISDLLDLTKLEAHSLPITRDHIEVGGLIADACDMLRLIAEEKGVALDKDSPAGSPPIFADRERILQVLSNLIGNAIKFTPAQGQVRVTAQPSTGGVRFFVRDTGPGIAKKDLPRVFDRFWQGGRDVSGGAGLGLAIAKAIVLAHGGHIGVESEPGVGSTFHFFLPGIGAIGRRSHEDDAAPAGKSAPLPG